ncbi:MAG TPA: hypothetical protein V6C57_12865, partial [Coleofasciculaceae cyanobacterium]
MISFLLALFLTLLAWIGAPLPVQAQSYLYDLTGSAQSAAPSSLEALRAKAFEATNTGDFATAETYWTQLLEQLPEEPAIWSNRGNARVSQNKLELAIADYDRA